MEASLLALAKSIYYICHSLQFWKMRNNATRAKMWNIFFPQNQTLC